LSWENNMYLHTRAVCYFSFLIYVIGDLFWKSIHDIRKGGKHIQTMCIYESISLHHVNLLPLALVYSLWNIVEDFFSFFLFSKEAPPVTCQTFKMPRDCCHIFSNQGNLHMDSNPWNLVSMIIMSTGTFTCRLAFRFKSLHLLK
jgi:hypothetical protein